MKNLLLFFLTCIVGTGAFLSATTMSNPWPAFAIGFGVWLLFLKRITTTSKRSAERKNQERLFNEWYRNHGRFSRKY